jgi:hypothetical protein
MPMLPGLVSSKDQVAESQSAEQLADPGQVFGLAKSLCE